MIKVCIFSLRRLCTEARIPKRASLLARGSGHTQLTRSTVEGVGGLCLVYLFRLRRIDEFGDRSHGGGVAETGQC